MEKSYLGRAMMLGLAVGVLLTSCDKKCAALDLFPQEEGLRKGTLSNGMSYYLRENSYDTKKASLRLAVKVGSICEEEDERGLAHFLEHMVFRGTKSYSDGEIISYLESIGAAFGAHTNAYTAYDETVYMLELPLEKEGVLEKALAIFSEMAMEANLEEGALNIEKGVVLDEMRLRESQVSGRTMMKVLESFMEGSLYGKRAPIGLEKVIQECTQEKLTRFYKKWYHPENMAIIAVGDFDAEAVEALVRKHFSKKSRHKKSEQKEVAIEGFRENLVDIYKDSETTSSSLVMGYWQPNLSIKTQQDFKCALLDQLIMAVINRRWQAAAQRDPSPFKAGFFSLMPLVKPATIAYSYCVLWEENPFLGLQTLLSSYRSMQKQPFTLEEFHLVVEDMKMGFKVALENARTHRNLEYSQKYVQHFTRGGPLMSYEKEAELSLALLNTVSLDDLNRNKEALFAQGKTKLIYVPTKTQESFSLEDLKLALDSVEEDKLPDGRVARLDLTSLCPTKGSIKEEKFFDKTGIKKLVLSNGMSVYLQKSDLKEKQVVFQLEAKKGLTSFEKPLFHSASVACAYIQKSGLAGLSSFELGDALAGKQVNLYYGMDFNRRLAMGDAATKDLQELFKLLQALFLYPTYREEAWRQMSKMVDDFMMTKQNNPQLVFMEKLAQCNHGHHYVFEEYNSKDFFKEESEKVFGCAFGNPSEFTLTLVGDYDEKEVTAYLETYLASIPSEKEPFPETKVLYFDFPEGIHACTVEAPATVQESEIHLASPLDTQGLKGGYEDFYHIELAKTIVQTRLLKALRMQEGETYSVQVRENFPLYPSMNSARFEISFSAAPAQVESMAQLMLKELACFKELPPTAEEVEKAVKVYQHKQAQALQTNQGQLKRIVQQLVFDQELASFFEDGLEKPSSEEVYSMMKRFFNKDNYSLHV
ncbi:MAG: insulinase family protein, partial [Chlamydiae bacterium]|nr:insulinase family protein [Chlamydiota bacterium]